MRPFTLIVPYYENAGMFCAQQEQWATLPEDIRSALHIIVVDDGSPEAAAQPHVRSVDVASYRVYRTGVDVRWNWLFCRNLGAAEATTEWLLMTDIDHVVPAQTWRELMSSKLKAQNVYRFSRVDAPDMTPYKPHPNSWAFTKDMFDRIGGYDERLSGFYGTDGEFGKRVQRAAANVVMLDAVLIRYPREVIPDASTTTYERKAPYDKPNVNRIVAERLMDGRPPLRLSFPWERVA